MNAENLNLIEPSVDNFLNIIVSEEELPYEIWLKPLLDWRDILVKSNREIKTIKRENKNGFPDFKEELIKELQQYLENLREESSELYNLDDDEIYEKYMYSIESRVYNYPSLTSNEILIIVYATLYRFLGKIKNEDFSEFYEFFELKDKIESSDDHMFLAWFYFFKLDNHKKSVSDEIASKLNLNETSFYVIWRKVINLYNKMIEIPFPRPASLEPRPLRTKELIEKAIIEYSNQEENKNALEKAKDFLAIINENYFENKTL
jgi:hypothetical protein